MARCSVDYAGRLSAHLPLATRLLMLKADGSVLVHSDSLSYKPLNWMTPPCTFTILETDAVAAEFGVIETDPSDPTRIAAFREKPADPVPLADSPGEILASMGNYVFTTEALLAAVRLDAGDEGSVHDMGGNIIPMMVARGGAQVYDFSDNDVPGATDRDRGYWRDVGTLDSYYDAHMDLVSIHPVFNLYNRQWPILTTSPALPPAKFVFEEAGRVGQAVDSLVSQGVIVSGGTVRRSIVSPGVRVHSGSEVSGSVLLHGVDVGRGAVVKNAILDKGVVVWPGARIGVDPGHDAERGYTVTPGGVVVVGKGQQVPV